MQEKELQLAGGELRYIIKNEQAVITGYQGMASELVVPETIESVSVMAVEKKAFLSKKHLRRIVLPTSIQSIGEWAFAYCSNLEEFVLGACDDGDSRLSADGDAEEVNVSDEKDSLQTMSFGRAVFLDCHNLKRIILPHKKEDIAHLMATAVSQMDAYYLLDMIEAGSVEWLNKWDARMLTLLHTPDQEGYSKQVLCGEEDYGSTDFQAYLNMRRKFKVRLVLARLLHPTGLAEEVKQELENYLLTHTSGCESEEAWEVIRTEYGEDRAYYELFASVGCVHGDNLECILADIGENYPEMKAYFMRLKAEQIGYNDFFQELSLDL